MFNFLASQIPGPIFCTPASLGHASVTGMSIGNLQYILLHDIHNLLCDLILKYESTSPEFVWGFQCSLLGSKIHYLGQEKSNSLHGSTQVVNIHYLGQIHNLGQNNNRSHGFGAKFLLKKLSASDFSYEWKSAFTMEKS